MPLASYRAEIDTIDTEIKQLFLKRMKIVEQVAEYKLEHNLEVLQPNREKELLARLSANLTQKDAADIQALYKTILMLSRNHQENIIEEHKKEG